MYFLLGGGQRGKGRCRGQRGQGQGHQRGQHQGRPCRWGQRGLATTLALALALAAALAPALALASALLVLAGRRAQLPGAARCFAELATAACAGDERGGKALQSGAIPYRS